MASVFIPPDIAPLETRVTTTETNITTNSSDITDILNRTNTAENNLVKTIFKLDELTASQITDTSIIIDTFENQNDISLANSINPLYDSINTLYEFGSYSLFDSLDSITGWTSSDIVNSPVSLNTTIFQEGTGSMQWASVDTASFNDTLTKIFIPTHINGIRFYVRQSILPPALQFAVRLKDSNNNSIISAGIQITAINIFEQKVLKVPENFSTETGLFDKTTCNTIQFYQVQDKNSATAFLFDKIEFLLHNVGDRLQSVPFSVSPPAPKQVKMNVSGEGLSSVNFFVSRDGGVTFTQVTLGNFTDIQSQPSGTNIVLRAVVADTMNHVRIRAWSLQYK